MWFSLLRCLPKEDATQEEKKKLLSSAVSALLFWPHFSRNEEHTAQHRRIPGSRWSAGNTSVVTGSKKNLIVFFTQAIQL